MIGGWVGDEVVAFSVVKVDNEMKCLNVYLEAIKESFREELFRVCN